MKEKMAELEARRVQLSGKLEALGVEEAPLRLHPRLAKVYRRKIDDLTRALNRPETRAQAAEALRALITVIRLTPTPQGYAIKLRGELAAIMALEPGQTEMPRLRAEALSETMVAGVGFEPTTFRL